MYRIMTIPRRAQRGISMVELLVALVLGLLIIAGLLQVYLSSRQSQQLQDALTSRQETLRFGTLLLTRDLRMAGYRGCLRDTGHVINTLNSPNAYLNNFDVYVQGAEATGGAWAPALDASITPVEPGTDVLTIRTTLDAVVQVAQEMPTSSAVVRITPNINPLPFATGGGDIVLISDCGGASIFQITQYTPASGTVVHNPGQGAGLPSPGNSTQNLGRRYPVGSELSRIATVSYFIRQSASGNGLSLWRRQGNAAAQELVDGVEDLQLLYGVDLDGDRVPEEYRKANAVTDWTRIVSVRVGLLAASSLGVGGLDPRSFTVLDKTAGPFSDGRLRRVIEFTVSIRNHTP